MTTSELAWMTYFAALVAMDRHPGVKTPQHLWELADQADQMLQLHQERYPCPGSP